MVSRVLKTKAIALLDKYPIITITGPRQSGKTTLCKMLRPDLPYINLEEPDVRAIAQNDPRAFLSFYPKGAILDEVQRVPDLFSYVQGIVDANDQIKFILSGSQNFLLLEQISQSLAGRTAILKLLPLSLEELKNEKAAIKPIWKHVYDGFYPRMYDKDISANDFFQYYIQTYVERDVRLLVNIGDMTSFINFIKLCAGRTGQLINYSSLANDAGVSINTVKKWMSVLEASYILYRLNPHHKNYNKRLTKQSKLYFFDTGLACSLLNIASDDQLKTHFLRGALFENFVLNEIIKSYHNRGKEHPLFFWRDNKGREVDCLIDSSDQLIPLEIKSGETMTMSYFNGLHYWNKLSGNSNDKSYVVYAGEKSMRLTMGNLLSWEDMDVLWFLD